MIKLSSLLLQEKCLVYTVTSAVLVIFGFGSTNSLKKFLLKSCVKVQ